MSNYERESPPGRLPGSSRWSLWSEDSVLSIASRGSVLSIGSIGSFASIGSVGSALSIGSIGSWLSIGSGLSSLSRWSLMSHRSSRGVLAASYLRRARPASGITAPSGDPPQLTRRERHASWRRTRGVCKAESGLRRRLQRVGACSDATPTLGVSWLMFYLDRVFFPRQMSSLVPACC